MYFDVNKLEWTRKPEDYTISSEKIEIVTKPHTGLWQRTYNHFRNDNAPVLQIISAFGQCVTNNGYSDWATTEMDASVKSMWYRLSSREDDFCIEYSIDGKIFHQMRICHMWKSKDEINFGIYACSPEDSSFKAAFSNMEMTDCQWPPHDGHLNMPSL